MHVVQTSNPESHHLVPLADSRPTLLVDGMKAAHTSLTDHIHAKITFAMQFVLKQYCKDTTGCCGVLFSSLQAEVAHICYLGRTTIVTDKVKTVGRSFSCSPSSASFQSKHVERHGEHAGGRVFERHALPFSFHRQL